MSVLRSIGPLLIGVGAAMALHLLLVPRIQQFHAKILLDIGINIVLAVSLNIVNGFTGQFSIGHAGFMAVGGYTAAATTCYFGGSRLWGDQALSAGLLSWPLDPARFDGPLLGGGDGLFLAACLVGGLVAAALGFIVGLPSLRLRGDYLAIVTLGFGEVVRLLIEQSYPQLDSLEKIRQTAAPMRFAHLGGALGFSGLTPYTTHFWVYLFVSAMLVTAYRLRQSSHGRAMLAIREDAIAAEAMGVPVTRYKVMAFMLAAFFAGIAGGLFAHQLGTSLNPGELGFQKSFDVLIMVVLGGLGSISGSVLAAVIITLLPELLRQPPHLWHVAVVVLVLMLSIGRRIAIRPALVLIGLVAAWETLRAVAVAREIDLSRYRLILYALSLVLMMILRPQGLFGLREAWELWPGRRRAAA